MGLFDSLLSSVSSGQNSAIGHMLLSLLCLGKWAREYLRRKGGHSIASRDFQRIERVGAAVRARWSRRCDPVLDRFRP